MKYALPGALLLCLASTSVVAQVDCSALGNASGVEPPGYALHCRGYEGGAFQSVKSSAAVLVGDAVTGYAIQMTTEGNPATQGLYAFTMPDFSAATIITGPENWSTTAVRNMAFNPGGSRLFVIQTTVFGSQLARLDPSVPQYIATGPVSGPDPRVDQVIGFAINPRNGQAWITTNRNFTNNPPLGQSWLWRLDLSTGLAQYVGMLLPEQADPVMIDIAINCSGQMYGHNISDDSLYHINTNDLTVTHVGSHGLPANFAQGMDFDKRDGSLYAWIYTGAGDNQFGTLDLETGAFEALSQNSPRGEWIGAIPSRCQPLAIDDLSGMNGTWYDPATSGQGFTLRYYPESNQVFMPWFTMMPASEDDDDDDDETPSADAPLRWFAIEGSWTPGSSELVAPIVAYTGGVFDTGGGVQSAVVGQARLSFISCDLAILDYAFSAGELVDRSGSINLTRTLPAQADCQDFDGHVRPVSDEYDPAITGTWYDPNTDGQGLEIARIPAREAEGDTPADPGILFAAWFTYDPASEDELPPGETQHWFTIQGQSIDADEPDVIRSTIYVSIGGTFDATPAFSQRPVGTATLESLACDRLKLTYEFEDAESAMAFRDLQGEIELYRLGACLPTPPED